MLDMLTTRVGDHRTEEGRALLTAHSPLTYAERIQKPLLIGQGANDPRVKQAESNQIVKAIAPPYGAVYRGEPLDSAARPVLPHRGRTTLG